MSWKTPDEQGGNGGSSPAIDATIEESFWESHLWPPHHPPSPPPPPPLNIFSRGSATSGDAAGSFAFPVVAGGGEGCNWGVAGKEMERMVAVGPLVKAGDAGKKEEKGKGKKRDRDGHGGKEDIAARVSVNGERERRKKMRIMFANLQALLPRSNKADKTSIVEEAISYIKTLETHLEALEEYSIHHSTTAVVTYVPLSTNAPVHLKLAGKTTRESFLAEYGSSPTSISQAHHKPSMVPGPNNYESEQQGSEVFQTWTSSNVVLNTFGKDKAMIMACSRKKPGLLTAIAAVLEKHRVEVEAANIFCDGHHCSLMIHARLANLGASEQCPNSSCAEGVYKEAVKELMLLVVDN